MITYFSALIQNVQTAKQKTETEAVVSGGIL